MILCVQIEKLGHHLSTLAPLINRYQRGEAGFVDEALKWLEETEKTMSELRLPEGSHLSVLRGRILRAGDAAQPADGQSLRSAIRRARAAAAADALDAAEALLRRRVLAAEERLRLFEEKLSEGFTALMLQGPLPENRGSPLVWMNATWTQLKQLSSTRALALYLAASLGPVDRLYILDRVLNRATAEGLAQR